MTTTTDYAALCAAIDEGDDSALPALADWLEEQGMAPPSWFRNKRPGILLGLFTWQYEPWFDGGQNNKIPVMFRRWERLSSMPGARLVLTGVVGFTSRSAAYLALAEALS